MLSSINLFSLSTSLSPLTSKASLSSSFLSIFPHNACAHIIIPKRFKSNRAKVKAKPDPKQVAIWNERRTIKALKESLLSKGLQGWRPEDPPPTEPIRPPPSTLVIPPMDPVTEGQQLERDKVVLDALDEMGFLTRLNDFHNNSWNKAFHHRHLGMNSTYPVHPDLQLKGTWKESAIEEE